MNVNPIISYIYSNIYQMIETPSYRYIIIMLCKIREDLIENGYAFLAMRKMFKLLLKIVYLKDRRSTVLYFTNHYNRMFLFTCANFTVNMLFYDRSCPTILYALHASITDYLVSPAIIQCRLYNRYKWKIFYSSVKENDDAEDTY